MTKRWIRRAGVLLGLLLWGAAHAGTVTYVYTDPQGTPLAEADANGNITATFDYAPYGKQAMGSAPNGPGYTGHVNDPDTGLVYMQARYYDPVVGRFLSADPVTPAPGNLFNFNRYDYTSNNPINHTDPDGRCSDADGSCGRIAQSFGNNPEAAKPMVPYAIAAVGVMAAASGAGELDGAAKVIAKVLGGGRQTGGKIVSRLAKNAIKDDIKGNVRQIVKSGEHMQKDASAAMKGAKIGESPGTKGTVQTAEHGDGTRVSVRAFSGKDGSGQPTIQVNDPATKIVTKVRYEEH